MKLDLIATTFISALGLCALIIFRWVCLLCGWQECPNCNPMIRFIATLRRNLITIGMVFGVVVFMGMLVFLMVSMHISIK